MAGGCVPLYSTDVRLLAIHQTFHFMFLAFVTSRAIRTRLARINEQRGIQVALLSKEELELRSPVVEKVPGSDVRYVFMTWC